MSTPCATLPLRAVLSELVDQSTEVCDLVQLREHGESGVRFRAASFLDDYLFRPSVLSSRSLYEYVAKHFRRKRSETSAECALFQPDHPLYDSHCVGTHIDEVVPVVVGMRMPFVDSETPIEYIVKRSRCALVLFKPFRGAANLVKGDPADDNAWIEGYTQWEPTHTSFIRELMANMDDYHRAARQAEECYGDVCDSGEMHAGSSSDGDEVTGTRGDVDGALCHATACDVNSNAAGADAFYHHLFDDCSNDNIDVGDATYRSEDTSSHELTLPIFPNAGPSGGYQHLLRAVARSTAGTAPDLRSHSSQHNFSIDELQRFVKDTSNEEKAEPQRSQSFRNERPTEVIELLKNALQDSTEWLSPAKSFTSPSLLRAYSSIGEVSRAFTLNRRQHAAFALIATSLLKRYLHQEIGGLDTNDRNCSGSHSSNATRVRDEQLLMYLGGAGGTGKSRVIDAIHAFSTSWHRDDDVENTALTGKAATLIGGHTLASFMMRLKHAVQNKHFAPLDLLVIDEVSMMSKAEWLKLDKVLRQYKQVPSVPFGGVHIVLVGDFLQMPPVKDDPIYMDPAEKQKSTTVDVEGFELWRQIITVIVLDESVRFRNDPEWGAGCGLARLDQWTPEFIDLVNSRVLKPSHYRQQQQHEPASQLELRHEITPEAVFVTPENTTRLAINNVFVAETASMLPSSTFPVRIVANFKGALNGLSQSDLRYVMGLPDNRFGRMAPYLDLIEGMPVQVTQNVVTAKGIANGTLGTFESVHLPDDTSFRLVHDGGTNTIVQLPSRAPDYAMLRVTRLHASPIRPGVDPDLFPVCYATEAYQKMTITLPRAPDGTPRSITVKPQQLPFVCAVGSTVYKVQGETLHSMVVVGWRSKHRIVNKPQQTYLLVSRVTSRFAFIALQPLTSELAAWSKPPTSALHEEVRLNRLSDANLATFYSSMAATTATT